MPGQGAGIQASFLFRGQLTFLGDSLLFSEIRGHEIGDQDLTQNAPNESHGGLMVRGFMVDHQAGSLQRPAPLMGMGPGHCSLTPE